MKSIVQTVFTGSQKWNKYEMLIEKKFIKNCGAIENFRYFSSNYDTEC